LVKQHETFEKRSQLFKNIYDGLRTAHNRIEDQNQKIEEGDKTLAALNGQLSEMDSELGNKELTLLHQEAKITKTRQIVIALSIISIIIALLVLLLFINQRQKKKQNQQLEKQQKEIALKNEILVSKNLELQVQRDLVVEKNTLINELNQRLEIKVNDKTAELTETIDDLNKTVKELDRFIYSTSHELSAPLKSVLGLINVAKNDKHGTSTEYYGLIEESVHKLENVIQSFVTFSRNARLDVQKEDCNLHHITSEIVENIKYYDNASAVNIKINLPDDTTILTDKMRLKIILNNLISNSIKYYDPEKEDSWVEISFENTSDMHVLTFRDNGIGINPDQTDKIFNMFHRASDKSTGTGLGLYIVKEAIDHLEGSIEVNSEKNMGTTFTVAIPNEHYFVQSVEISSSKINS